jgi:hypothetical protein
MALHVLHNSLILSLPYLGPQLQAHGWDIENQKYLPLPLLLTTTAIATVAAVILAAATRRARPSQTAPA